MTRRPQRALERQRAFRYFPCSDNGIKADLIRTRSFLLIRDLTSEDTEPEILRKKLSLKFASIVTHAISIDLEFHFNNRQASLASRETLS